MNIMHLKYAVEVAKTQSISKAAENLYMGQPNLSKSIKELEDTCDQLALLDRGGLVFQSETEKLKTQKFKLQVAFSEDYGKEKFAGLDVINYSKHGLVCTLLVGGEREAVLSHVRSMSPVLLEELPLTLEEVFTYELRQRGYDEEGRV